MCSAQQNPPRTVSGINPETIVLYTVRPTPAKTRWAPLSRRATFWAQDRLLLWLSLISQRLTRPVHPWPSHEVLVGTQQGSRGDLAVTEVYGFLHVQVPGD